jgi:hypothetical protein
VRDGRPPAHAYLGIQMDTLTPDLAATYNADPNTGVLVEATPGVLVTKVRMTSVSLPERSVWFGCCRCVGSTPSGSPFWGGVLFWGGVILIHRISVRL